MKTMIAVAVAGIAVSANGQELLSWWSFNNTNNDSDLMNSNGDDNARPNFGHMIDNNDPFDDGFYDNVNGRLYGVADTFGGNPGALVGAPSLDPGAGVPDASGYGAWIDINGLVGDNFASGTAGNWGSFSGTGTNRPSGTFGGGSLAITGEANNGSFFDIVADLSGWQDIEVTWANRGTSTGFAERNVSVSNDGGATFTSIYNDAGSLSSSWTTELADAGALLDGASNAIIRFSIAGASSTSGNNRFDNIQLLGTAIPAPASAALLALGGLVATRRR